jgi:hypothetical protein
MPPKLRQYALAQTRSWNGHVVETEPFLCHRMYREF